MNNSMVKKYRNINIDLLKLIASLGVVILHTIGVREGWLGYMLAVATFSVPIFFICSGYLSYKRITQKGYVGQRIKNLLRYFVVGFFLSFGWDILGRNIQRFNFSRESIFDFILFNATEFFSKSFALWFIMALIYCYIICSIKFLYALPWKIKLIISGCLIMSLLILEKISISGNSGINIYYYRNFLFVGIPSFLIGEIIAENNEKILWCKSLYCTAIIIGLAFVLIERSIVGCFIDYYLGSFIMAIAMFMFCISAKETVFINGHGAIIGEISTYIYLFHVFVSGIAKKIFGDVRGIVFSGFVFIVTMIVSLIYVKAKKVIKVIIEEKVMCKEHKN